MGFYSWKTADTKESIANIHSGHKNADKSSYLLQPNGKSSFEENYYEGYGIFGGVEAYSILAQQNFSDDELEEILQQIDDKEEGSRIFGIELDFGKYYEDINTKEKFSYSGYLFNNELTPFDGNYGTIEPKYGKTPNELIKDKVWKAIPFVEIFNLKEYKPLKFSFNENAVYEELPASENCEEQGFFY